MNKVAMHLKMRHGLWKAYIASVFIALTLVACAQPDRTGTASNTPSPTSGKTFDNSTVPPSTPQPTASPGPTSAKKPADADGPGAAPCTDIPSGDRVTFTLEPDVPQPRCSKGGPAQHLLFLNKTPATATIQLGSHSVIIAPGGQGEIDDPLGNYLQPGVHFINVSTYSGGPELWLMEK